MRCVLILVLLFSINHSLTLPHFSFCFKTSVFYLVCVTTNKQTIHTHFSCLVNKWLLRFCYVTNRRRRRTRSLLFGEHRVGGSRLVASLMTCYTHILFELRHNVHLLYSVCETDGTEDWVNFEWMSENKWMSVRERERDSEWITSGGLEVAWAHLVCNSDSYAAFSGYERRRKCLTFRLIISTASAIQCSQDCVHWLYWKTGETLFCVKTFLIYEKT